MLDLMVCRLPFTEAGSEADRPATTGRKRTAGRKRHERDTAGRTMNNDVLVAALGLAALARWRTVTGSP